VTTPKFCRFLSSVSVHPRYSLALWGVLCFLEAQLSYASPAPQWPEGKAEKPYAQLYGTVFGPDERGVYGVRVKIRRADEKKARWELYSDHSGEVAQRVPAGRADYVIWTDLHGYKSLDGKRLQPGPEVTVHIENDERVNFSLHLR
jgi:hypothetical protein